MTSIRRLASALCLALCFSGYSNAQDYVSDNLVNDTWYGTINNTTVTGGEGSHTQSSGPTPIYNPDTNTITWSYSQTSVLNIIGINAALSAAGTGIRISGYNYSWEYYNQDFSRGFLSATTQQYGLNGTLLEQYSYQMPQTTSGWTQFSGTQNYTNQYELTQLGDFYLYFTGRDDRFWAGYYGPMVRNPSITFNYTVGAAQPEPESCYTLVCPGSVPTYTEPTIVPEVASTPTESIVVESAPSSMQESMTQSTPESSTTSTSETSGGSRVSLSTVLSIVANEQSRISSVERSTVESSIEQSASQANQAVQEAEAVAESSSTESVSISITAQDQAGGTGLSFFSSTLQSSSTLPFGSSLRQSESSNENVQAEESKNENVSVSGFSAVDILKQDANVSDQETANEQQSQTVKRDTPNNELAGGVTLAALSTQPRGFEAYSLTMPDAQFYVPREIYRNQTVIDNPSSRRLFGGSDRVFQQMVDQQYIGK
jgi:hypothetical protein